jgi:acyl-homoserine-lactone acylase
MYSKQQKNGIYKGFAGESHIELVRFGPEGVELETVNTYGASAKPGTAHFTDQMDLFANKKLKVMSLDMDKAMKEAERVYSPMKVLSP